MPLPDRCMTLQVERALKGPQNLEDGLEAWESRECWRPLENLFQDVLA